MPVKPVEKEEDKPDETLTDQATLKPKGGTPIISEEKLKAATPGKLPFLLKKS